MTAPNPTIDVAKAKAEWEALTARHYSAQVNWMTEITNWSITYVEPLLSALEQMQAENERLSEAVCSGILPGLLTPDESDALVDFVKFLGAEKPLGNTPGDTE